MIVVIKNLGGFYVSGTRKVRSRKIRARND